MKNDNIVLNLLILPIIIFAAFSGGCVSPDAGNTSARPWNEPRGYDTGIIGRDPRRGF
jgi:hypothetical protein